MRCGVSGSGGGDSATIRAAILSAHTDSAVRTTAATTMQAGEMTEYLIAFNGEWVPDQAAKIAVACGWPQEVRRFQVPMQLPERP
jgi:hypothetical protein